jgi:hypothetical protein
MQKRPHVRSIAAARVLVVVGDECPNIRRIARLGRSLGFIDEFADLVLGRAGGSAAGNGERRGQREKRLMQEESPTAAGRR